MGSPLLFPPSWPRSVSPQNITLPAAAKEHPGNHGKSNKNVEGHWPCIVCSTAYMHSAASCNPLTSTRESMGHRGQRRRSVQRWQPAGFDIADRSRLHPTSTAHQSITGKHRTGEHELRAGEHVFGQVSMCSAQTTISVVATRGYSNCPLWHPERQAKLTAVRANTCVSPAPSRTVLPLKPDTGNPAKEPGAAPTKRL